MIKTLIGNKDFIESLRGKKATFMLAMSNTKTADIEGITQAGIPGLIHLTPTLDSEFICSGEVRSLEDIAKTPKGVPTPALITRAVHLLSSFGRIELLNLGMEVAPKVKYFKQHSFDIKPSHRIDTNAQIAAETLFQRGVEFGEAYICKDEYIILGESVPSGTTTAKATALALGYQAQNYFSSSFKEVPHSIREETITKSLENITQNDTIYDKLGKVSDNMLIFNAGFIYGLNNRVEIVLAGGTQMACVLLVLNSILKERQTTFDTSNIALCTTRWIAKDKHSNIKALLEMLDFPIQAYYASFDFSLTTHPALKLYDEGEAKEGVGAGAALIYASLHGITKEAITRQIESFLIS